jgi:hypothetical protein
MSPLPPTDGPPGFSLLARPAGRPRLGLMQAILAFAGAIAAAVSPFALVVGAAMLSARYGFDPDARSVSFRLVLGAGLIAVGLAVSIGAYRLFQTLFERAQQRRQQPLADWADLDGRFALLLRTFDDDRRRILLWSVRVQLPFDLTQPWERLELQIVRAFRPLMPVIAVGRPGEPLPQLGARRFYVRDEDWREAVLYALKRCAAVIVVVGPGEGLRWEIGQALRRTPPDGAVFLFPLMHPPKPSLLLRLGLGRSRLAYREQEQRYEAFVGQLKANGIAGFPPQLEGKQVVLVDRHGQSIPLGEKRPRGTLSKPFLAMGVAAMATMIVGSVFRIEATPIVFVAVLWFGLIRAMRRSRTGAFDEALKLVVRRLQTGRPSSG